jgi:hypothetical protein
MREAYYTFRQSVGVWDFISLEGHPVFGCSGNSCILAHHYWLSMRLTRAAAEGTPALGEVLPEG